MSRSKLPQARSRPPPSISGIADLKGPGASGWIVHVVAEEESGRTVEEILTGPMRLSRRMLQRLTRSKGVTLNRRPVYLGRKVRSGDRVEARASDSPAVATLPPHRMALSIAYEDRDVIVVDKPAGLLVHPTHAGSPPTLAHGLAHHFELQGISAAVRPVHRLDRDTSGLVVVAKSGYAHQQLDRQLREGSLVREYLAVVEGVIRQDEGVIDAPIGRVSADARSREVRAGGDPARTRFTVKHRFADATLLEVRLETGRTHQIRVHMKHLGHPVIGDQQYGGKRSVLRRQALHAARISFEQPRTGEAVTCSTPIPPDMAQLLETLGLPADFEQGGSRSPSGGAPAVDR